MKLIEIIESFTNTVDYLTKPLSSGKTLYVEKDEYILFRPSSFRTALGKNIPGSNKFNKLTEERLNEFKELGLIATDKDRNRFTRTQKVNGRVMKVIAVKRSAYLALKKIQKEEADVEN